MDIYAHRGGAGIYPEHTIKAYEHVIELGVDVIDIDICKTKDGILIAHHDLTLNPDITRDKSGKFIQKKTPIRELTYKELLQYNVGAIDPRSSYHKNHPHQIPLEFAHIPTLREILKLGKNQVRFQIELKSNDLIKTLIPLLIEEDLLHETEIQSFHFDSLDHLPHHTAYVIEEMHITPTELVKRKANTLCPHHSLVTKELVQESHAHNLRVVPWSPNDPKEMKRLKECKVDGLITDRPDLALQI